MNKQVERIGVETKREEVEQVDWLEDNFTVTTPRTIYTARYLVVASGTKSRPLPDVISPDAQDKVFTEVWPLYKEEGKRIIIIGTGDAAFDYALNLAKKRNFVTILNRGETVKCLELLFERAAQEPGIQYRTGVAVRWITSDESAGRLEVQCETAGQDTISLYADYILFAIGRVPNLDFLSAEVMRRERELVDAGRLYWIGDVKNELFRQVAIAAGDGLRAAMQIYARIST
jgi:thioredoxin reductase